MKKISLILLFLSLALAANTFAVEETFLDKQLQPKYTRAELEPEGTPLRKLQRGFLNVVLSPFEISNELHKEKREGGFPPSWFTGAARGVGFAVVRAATGVFEILTFPFETSSNNEALLEPEMPMQLVEPDTPTKS